VIVHCAAACPLTQAMLSSNAGSLQA
jgi:hypothetical protein